MQTQFFFLLKTHQDHGLSGICSDISHRWLFQNLQSSRSWRVLLSLCQRKNEGPPLNLESISYLRKIWGLLVDGLPQLLHRKSLWWWLQCGIILKFTCALFSLTLQESAVECLHLQKTGVMQLRTSLLAVPLPISATTATICWATSRCSARTTGAGAAFHHLALVRHAIHMAAWAGNLALLCPWVSVGFHSEMVKASQNLRNYSPKYSHS